MVFSAAYSLALYTHTMLGEASGFFVKYFSDFSRREFYMVNLLVILTIVFGIFPNLIILMVEGNLPSYLDLVLLFLIS
jgi:NADH:ubiquinone oxidoreductase subunit 4 (subunit M)